MIDIRLFNAAGISKFRNALDEIKDGQHENLPDDLISNDEFSEVAAGYVKIEAGVFESKLQAAHYLLPKINSLTLTNPFYNAGLWAWLSAFYFDSVCPVEDNGQRVIKSIYRYIPDEEPDWRNYYRHLLAFPVRIYQSHGDIPLILLSGPVHKMGDYVEQLASRQDLAMSRGILEAANILYWDTSANRPKRGSAPNSHKPGTLRRFIDLVYQLDPTFDLQGMNGQQVLALLPKEFFS